MKYDYASIHNLCIQSGRKISEAIRELYPTGNHRAIAAGYSRWHRKQACCYQGDANINVNKSVNKKAAAKFVNNNVNSFFAWVQQQDDRSARYITKRIPKNRREFERLIQCWRKYSNE